MSAERHAIITGTGHAVPSRLVTNDELAAAPAQVDRGHGTVSRPERVKRRVIASELLAAANDDLTPTRKVKRREMTARDGSLIASLYE